MRSSATAASAAVSIKYTDFIICDSFVNLSYNYGEDKFLWTGADLGSLDKYRQKF